jgi:hypothetical protein
MRTSEDGGIVVYFKGRCVTAGIYEDGLSIGWLLYGIVSGF